MTTEWIRIEESFAAFVETTTEEEKRGRAESGVFIRSKPSALHTSNASLSRIAAVSQAAFTPELGTGFRHPVKALKTSRLLRLPYN